MDYSFNLDDYDYPLNPSLIAQYPVKDRDSSKLLVLDRDKASFKDCTFKDIVKFLNPGDCLVLNDSRVFPARLFGKKETGGKVELFLLHFPQQIDKGHAKVECLFRASKPLRVGMHVYCQHNICAKVIKVKEGRALVELLYEGPLEEVLDKAAKVPLPPYIKREEEELDRKCYQTVYARVPGSVAAPTAGLHFTKRLLEAIKEKGVELVTITLHVGYGTFAPIRDKDIRRHKIHSEWLWISKESAQKINKIKSKGGRIVAVGTTSVRALEAAGVTGELVPYSDFCDLYIVPGHEFKIVDAMITNFHLPKSSLIVLVSAFAGRQLILKAYRHAAASGYRFYSYGDAMFIF